jgi:hypothetical protein
MRYAQMERIAKTLRRHPNERRFTADVLPTLGNADSLQLLRLEMITAHWWPEEK